MARTRPSRPLLVAPLAGLAGAVLSAAPAFAHPGHGRAGLGSGLAHPVTGVDHLLAMVAVGVVAAAAVERGRTWLAPTAFLGGMLERGEGSIVTMSSISARFLDKPTQAAYAASKAGVIMFTRHLAQEVGEQGVRVNSVAPGTTMSERIERIMDTEAIERTKRLSPMNLMGMPEDTANATVFLLSDAARWLTGVTIDVNGGRVML